MPKTCDYFYPDEQEDNTILRHTKKDVSVSTPMELVKYCSKNCPYYEDFFRECAKELIWILLVNE